MFAAVLRRFEHWLDGDRRLVSEQQRTRTI
jgi:hypothetical protein